MKRLPNIFTVINQRITVQETQRTGQSFETWKLDCKYNEVPELQSQYNLIGN